MSWEVRRETGGRTEGAVEERRRQREERKEKQKGRFVLRWGDWHMGVAW